MNKDTLISAITNYQPHLLPETKMAAAVLLFIIFDEQDNLFLILTERPPQIEFYAGDYCLPGGMREMHDKDYLQTAAREAKEELGIEEQHYEVLGQLDDFNDRYGNLVRPFVALIAQKTFELHLQASAEEVASVYWFSLTDFKNIEIDTTLERVTGRHPSYIFKRNEVFIWGLTASIMVHFENVIEGKNRLVGFIPASPSL
jgi:8-oxo-dGTP pyrophosphatase MutT (NUDIX family)